MSMIDLFKEFHSRAIAEAYPPNVRALFDTLLYEFNAAHWTPELAYTERELSRLSSIPQATIHRTLRFLSDRAHIKTWSPKQKKTIVKLLGDNVPVPQDSRAITIRTESSVNQTRIKRESTGLVSCTRDAGEDVKTIKTGSNKGAGARQVAEATPAAEVEVADAKPLSSPISSISPITDANEIHGVWLKAFGYELRGNYALKLEMLAAEDYERVVTAIEQTAKKLPLDNPFAYFKEVYDAGTAGKAKSQPAQPAERNPKQSVQAWLAQMQAEDAKRNKAYR